MTPVALAVLCAGLVAALETLGAIVFIVFAGLALLGIGKALHVALTGNRGGR